ncbi:unnamed protein product, partial [Amoebophrya sp. A25]
SPSGTGRATTVEATGEDFLEEDDVQVSRSGRVTAVAGVDGFEIDTDNLDNDDLLQEATDIFDTTAIDKAELSIDELFPGGEQQQGGLGGAGSGGGDHSDPLENKNNASPLSTFNFFNTASSTTSSTGCSGGNRAVSDSMRTVAQFKRLNSGHRLSMSTNQQLGGGGGGTGILGEGGGATSGSRRPTLTNRNKIVNRSTTVDDPKKFLVEGLTSVVPENSGHTGAVVSPSPNAGATVGRVSICVPAHRSTLEDAFPATSSNSSDMAHKRERVSVLRGELLRRPSILKKTDTAGFGQKRKDTLNQRRVSVAPGVVMSLEQEERR